MMLREKVMSDSWGSSDKPDLFKVRYSLNHNCDDTSHDSNKEHAQHSRMMIKVAICSLYVVFFSSHLVNHCIGGD